jgi:hypothetical protein
MAKYSVELLLEIEAATAEDAAELMLLEARTTSDPLAFDVYSDDAGSGRCWQKISVDVRTLEGEL